MARLPRLGLAGWPHLVLQRVHEGQRLTRDDTDRQTLIDALKEATRLHGVHVHAYSLADDRLYMLATPSSDEALSLVMQALGRRYVAAYNRRHGREGGLWAGRYRCTVLDPVRYLLDAMVFVEQQGWRTGRVPHWTEDTWCSLRHHLGLRTDPLVSDHSLFWELGNTPFEREAAWRRRLDDGLSEREWVAIAEAVHKGWALAPQADADKLATLAGRPMAPRPRGRPRKHVQLPGASTESEPSLVK